jgi:Z1 domain
MNATAATNGRQIITDGPHTTEVLRIFKEDGLPENSTKSILQKATEVIIQSVDPISGQRTDSSDGLLYGLIQSGKTSIITVAAALAADNGFACIVILTSDIDLLYDQTLERIKQALRGLNVLGKNDWRDENRFQRQLRTTPFVIVCSKNGNKLSSLLDSFRRARARGISALIIDDEADQASLNTQTSRGNNQTSRINQVITDLRGFFQVNTYLQVTATPQALFLQRPDHSYRPSFTVLSEPGENYVGGEQFFGAHSQLLKPVDLQEVNQLRASNQPTPNGSIPTGLKKALFTFLVGATAKIILGHDNSYAFLCHVSVNNRDHNFIVQLIDRFKESTIGTLQNSAAANYGNLINDLQEAYHDLALTQPGLPPLSGIVNRIKFYLQGTNIKLINATSTEEIKLDAAYNIFVGGNKLGRGVTIKNLLVSYYGRNPQRPNSDTVLQHARMYGYRQRELGVTRLFLPDRLADHFRLIHQMESALRDLVTRHPTGKFEGLFISTPLQATRRNVLDPNSIGIYVAGGYCNPIYPLRTSAMSPKTQIIDQKLQHYSNSAEYNETTISTLIELVDACDHDPQYGAELWNKKILKAALEKLRTILNDDKAYIRVRRDRNLNEPRRETQGFLSGGEDGLVPRDAPTIFIYRLTASPKGVEVWWPMVRFPDGNYVLAFSFNR